jgi:electron transfer flavoprotein beta subunit
MKITVLIKHVVDSTEVRFDKKTGELRLRGLPEKISDYDKHAIEAAVQLKTKVGGDVKALTFGKKEAFKSLKEAVAMGADEGILIAHGQANQIYDPVFVAKVLAKGIEYCGGCDLALFGAMSEDVTSKIIGPTVAAFLGLNHLSNVTKMEMDNESRLVTVSEMNGSEVEVESELPVALSVARTLNEPRLATKIQIMKVSMKKISNVSLTELGLSEDIYPSPRLEFESFTPITKERKRIILEGDAPMMADRFLEILRKEHVL